MGTLFLAPLRHSSGLILSLTAAWYFLVHPAAAQDAKGICGEPPPVTNESLKGEIKGEAQFLTRFLGDASLGGMIETSREEIFSKYGANERSDAYFEYMLCILLMSDSSLSTAEKIIQLRTVRQEFRRSIHEPAPAPSINVQDSSGVIIGDQNKTSIAK